MAGTSTGTRPGNIMFVRGETQGDNKDKVVNPDEIDIDDDEEDEGEDVPVEKQSIPSEVFGGLKKNDDSVEDEA
jgi:pre-mRNA-splicing factor SYF1